MQWGGRIVLMDPLFSDLVMPQIVQDMDKEAILNAFLIRGIMSNLWSTAAIFLVPVGTFLRSTQSRRGEIGSGFVSLEVQEVIQVQQGKKPHSLKHCQKTRLKKLRQQSQKFLRLLWVSQCLRPRLTLASGRLGLRNRFY